MFLLVAGGGEENRRELLVAFLSGALRKVRVLVSRLRFTGKCSLQVLFGLRARKTGNRRARFLRTQISASVRVGRVKHLFSQVA